MWKTSFFSVWNKEFSSQIWLTENDIFTVASLSKLQKIKSFVQLSLIWNCVAFMQYENIIALTIFWKREVNKINSNTPPYEVFESIISRRDTNVQLLNQQHTVFWEELPLT